MENPDTWGEAEKVIANELRLIAVDKAGGVIGLSAPRRIADALRWAELLAKCNCPAGMKYHALNCPDQPGAARKA